MARNRDRGDGVANGLTLVVLIIVMYSCSQSEKRLREAQQKLLQLQSPREASPPGDADPAT